MDVYNVSGSFISADQIVIGVEFKTGFD